MKNLTFIILLLFFWYQFTIWNSNKSSVLVILYSLIRYRNVECRIWNKKSTTMYQIHLLKKYGNHFKFEYMFKWINIYHLCSNTCNKKKADGLCCQSTGNKFGMFFFSAWWIWHLISTSLVLCLLCIWCF